MKNFWVSLMATLLIAGCMLGDEALAQTSQKPNSATEPSKATKPVNQPRAATSTRAKAAPKDHRVVIQVTQNEPALMNIALNNAQNLINHYQGKGEHVDIEFVAYGPGLHMLRSDTSPVKD